MKEIEIAKNSLTELCTQEFKLQFPETWAGGYIQITLLANGEKSSIAFARGKNGDGMWFEIERLDFIDLLAFELIKNEQIRSPNVNSVRVSVRKKRGSQIEYFESSGIWQHIPVRAKDCLKPLIDPSEEQMVRLSRSLLKIGKFRSFRSVTFRYYRLGDHFCAVLQMVKLNGQPQNIAVPYPNEIDLMLEEVWGLAGYPNWTVLQVSIHEDGSWHFKAFEDYILKTFEEKIFPRTTK